MVSYLPNGPTRKSSLGLLSEETLAQLPNGPAYEEKISIMSDAEWWAEHEQVLEDAFDAWIAGFRQRRRFGKRCDEKTWGFSRGSKKQ